MGRRKIEIKPIKDDRNRSVTFLKRKGGLFKKAHELSVLCSVDVAVIIFGSNKKKLYQYSSSDISEIINRHAYYDTAHESKGPADFKDKNLQDEDDDDDIPERAGSHSSIDHPLPPHMHRPGVHMGNRHTASASPPNMPKNLVGPGQYAMGARVGTPQPTMTRPSSRNQNHMQRRNSSNLVPPNSYPASQPPPQSNGVYAYTHHMPHHPSAYNPQPQSVMPMQQPSQMHGYPYPPQHPHAQHPPHPQQPQIQPPPQHQPHPQHSQHPQHPQQQQHQTQAQAQAEAFINETRRQSMPPAYTAEPVSEPEQSMSRPEQPSPPQGIEKRAPAKSRSMFTPIGPSDSVLAAHFGFGQQEQPRSHSIDVGAITRKNAEQSFGAPIKMEKPQAPPAIDTSPQLPSRSNSMADPKSAGMRPKLKVHIPTEAEEEASPDSSPRGSSATAGNQSARPANNEGGPVVLPPPSPSVSALLSAGATGPSNPFSRPPPASQAPEQTPMSALPSRFTEAILPSPSSFYGESWALPFPQRNNTNDNMLPSPLNFQTPIGASQQNFFKDAIETNGNGKRRSPGSDHSDSSNAKRVKT